MDALGVSGSIQSPLATPNIRQKKIKIVSALLIMNLLLLDLLFVRKNPFVGAIGGMAARCMHIVVAWIVSFFKLGVDGALSSLDAMKIESPAATPSFSNACARTLFSSG